MKKVLAIVAAVIFTVAAHAADPVNEKVLRSFNETFTNASNVKWAEYEDYYKVNFVLNGIRSTVSYSKTGDLLSAIRYYEPQMLPLNIYNNLRKSFPKMELFGVTEVSSNSSVSYYVKMESDKHWVTVRVNPSGSFEVTEKYEKA